VPEHRHVAERVAMAPRGLLGDLLQPDTFDARRGPEEEVIDEIAALDAESAEVLKNIRALL